MKKILFILVLVCLDKALQAQYVYTIKADSVKITNSCDTAELIIENHTQSVPGFLFNKGRGRTEFRKIFQNLTDTTFLIGIDTMKLLNFWRQGGNRFGTVGKFGTMDDNPIDFYTNGFKRGRWATGSGHLLINTDEDLDNYNFQVGGVSLFRAGAVVGTDNPYRIVLVPFGNSIGNTYYGPLLNFGYAATIGSNTQDLGNTPVNSLIINANNPQSWVTMADRSGNPTFVTSGGGEVTINGGYNGIQNGGSLGVGTDIPAYHLNIYGGRGTGTGTTGDIKFYTGNAQSSGTAIHSMDTARWVIKGKTGFLTNLSDKTPEPTSSIDITGLSGYSQFRLRKSYTPTSTTDPNGNQGDFSWDDNYFYIKTSTGWKRAALTTF